MSAGLGEIATLGASTKRGDRSTIGQYGTGNKYAIAYFLKHNIGIRLITGGREIQLSTEPITIKNQTFDAVLVDGQRAGFVTELGYKWQLWQAVRELYANAIDEGLLRFGIVEEYENGDPETTTFIIEETDEVKDLMLNFYKYFAVDEPALWENGRGRILAKKGKACRVFYRGFKCFETENDSLFDYDIFNIEITEDRVAKYYWDIEIEIQQLMAECDDPTIVRAMLHGVKNDVMESKTDSLYVSKLPYSQTWKNEIGKGQIFPKNMGGWLSSEEINKTFLMAPKQYMFLINAFGSDLKPKSMQFSDTGAPYTEANITDTRALTLSVALDFFTDAKFQFDYKIKIVDFKDKELLGSIDKEKQEVLIGVMALDRGADETINTCIEEYIHLKHGVADETRGFQTAVIWELINYMKTKIDVSGIE